MEGTCQLWISIHTCRRNHLKRIKPKQLYVTQPRYWSLLILEAEDTAAFKKIAPPCLQTIILIKLQSTKVACQLTLSQTVRITLSNKLITGWCREEWELHQVVWCHLLGHMSSIIWNHCQRTKHQWITCQPRPPTTTITSRKWLPLLSQPISSKMMIKKYLSQDLWM